MQSTSGSTINFHTLKAHSLPLVRFNNQINNATELMSLINWRQPPPSPCKFGMQLYQSHPASCPKKKVEREDA